VDVASAAGWAPIALLETFLAGGATVIQLRAKRWPSGPFLDLCDAAVALGAQCGARVIVNDRIDLALLSKAAGAHVGQGDVGPGDARAQLGPSAILGRSTHDETQIAGAASEPVTYIAVGPIFGSNTKATGYQPVGLELVRAARRLAPAFPIVAIGGITLDNARSVIEAGATAVAVIGDLVAFGDPAARIASYNRLASACPGG